LLCLKTHSIYAGSTSFVVGHCLAADDPNGAHEAMMVDADVQFIMFNPTKTKWYSNQDTKAEDFIPDCIPRKRMQLMFAVEDQNKNRLSVPDQVDDGYDLNIWKLDTQVIWYGSKVYPDGL
jgi:hypothetical protein